MGTFSHFILLEYSNLMFGVNNNKKIFLNHSLEQESRVTVNKLWFKKVVERPTKEYLRVQLKKWSSIGVMELAPGQCIGIHIGGFFKLVSGFWGIGMANTQHLHFLPQILNFWEIKE